MREITFRGKTAEQYEQRSAENLALNWVSRYGSPENAVREVIETWEGKLPPNVAKAADILRNHKSEFGIKEPGNIYEQTFFTDRAPGDESHLLKWYEPVSKENKQRIADALNAEKSSNGFTWKWNGDSLDEVSSKFSHLKNEHSAKTGGDLYRRITTIMGGSPKSASEFLARAGIDGIKYPVDSYGGKTVKDGDKIGWNYVSFRDDNIRVDHKWADGVARFSRGGVGAARKMSNDGSEYSYAGLTARPGMKLAQINPESFKNYRTDAERVRDAKDSVLAAGGRKIDGAVVIDMDGSDVVVSSSGIKHRGKKPHLENDMLYPVLGEVLKNAIPVNELAPRSGDKRDFGVKNTFVFLGAFAYKNEICPVRIQVVQKNNTRTLDSVDVLKSLNTKIGKVNAPDKSDLTREAPSALAEISIANLIGIAQPLHPEIFSKDVTCDVQK